jgi:hypothetical protein
MKNAIASLLVGLAFCGSVSAESIIIDSEDSNANVEFTGNWARGTSSSGFLGDGYFHDQLEPGFAEVVWSLPTVNDSSYELFTRWTSANQRATNATYVITHAHGESSIQMNQRFNGGEFVSLGLYESPTSVSLSNEGADNIVVADAIKLEELNTSSSEQNALTGTFAGFPDGEYAQEFISVSSSPINFGNTPFTQEACGTFYDLVNFDGQGVILSSGGGQGIDSFGQNQDFGPLVEVTLEVDGIFIAEAGRLSESLYPITFTENVTMQVKFEDCPTQEFAASNAHITLFTQK